MFDSHAVGPEVRSCRCAWVRCFAVVGDAATVQLRLAVTFRDEHTRDSGAISSGRRVLCCRQALDREWSLRAVCAVFAAVSQQAVWSGITFAQILKAFAVSYVRLRRLADACGAQLWVAALVGCGPGHEKGVGDRSVWIVCLAVPQASSPPFKKCTVY